MLRIVHGLWWNVTNFIIMYETQINVNAFSHSFCLFDVASQRDQTCSHIVSKSESYLSTNVIMLERVPLQEQEEINIEQFDDLNVDLNVDLTNDGDSEESDIDRSLDYDELLHMEMLSEMDDDERFDYDLMNNDDGFELLLQIEEDLQNGQ